MKKLVAFVLSIMISLCGCDAGFSRISAGATKHKDVLAVMYVAVPHYGFLDMRLDYIKLLETDEYGRNMYYYNLSNFRTGAVVIVQKATDEYVLYYEDYCYLVDTQKCEPEHYLEPELEWLKSKNDWNRPLAELKSSRIDSKSTPDDYEPLDYEAFKECFFKIMPDQKKESDFFYANALESYADGSQVVLVSLYFKKDEVDEQYLALYDSTDGIKEIEQIVDMDEIRESVIAFKAKCSAIWTCSPF